MIINNSANYKPVFQARVDLSQDQRYTVKEDKVLNNIYKKITSTHTDNKYDLKYRANEDYANGRDYIEVSGGRKKKIYDVNKNGKRFFSATTYNKNDKNFLKSVLTNILNEEENEIGVSIKGKIDLSIEKLCEKYDMSIKELIEYLNTKTD